MSHSSLLKKMKHRQNNREESIIGGTSGSDNSQEPNFENPEMMIKRIKCADDPRRTSRVSKVDYFVKNRRRISS